MGADDFELAADLVTDAGRLAAQMLAGGLTAKRKSSVSDLVTAADHSAEELVVARLRAERPEDGIVGEEGTNHPVAAENADRTWFVDPVDGTYNFAFGLSAWCSALALRDDDGLVLGAVYEPVTDLLWLGGRDRPTTNNEVPVTPLVNQPLSHCSLTTYLHPTSIPNAHLREPLLRVMPAAATVRMLGSGSVELASIAGGRLGAYVQNDCLDWDWFPGAALVEASGGATSVFEMNGHRWHVAGNHQVVEEIVALLHA